MMNLISLILFSEYSLVALCHFICSSRLWRCVSFLSLSVFSVFIGIVHLHSSEFHHHIKYLEFQFPYTSLLSIGVIHQPFKCLIVRPDTKFPTNQVMSKLQCKYIDRKMCFPINAVMAFSYYFGCVIKHPLFLMHPYIRCSHHSLLGTPILVVYRVRSSTRTSTFPC